MARSASGSRATVFAIIVLLICDPLHADDAVLLNGKRVSGTLRFGKSELTFVSGKAAEILPWNQIDRVEPASRAVAEIPAPCWWQARLINGDQFSCRLQEIESNAFVCDSAWFQSLRIRRGAIRALERPQGWCPFLVQESGRDVHGWKETHETGEPTAAVGMGGLALGPLTKSLQFVPDAPFPLGRIVLALKDGASGGGKRWQVRLELDVNSKTHQLSMTFGANAGADVQSSTLELRRQGGQISGTTILLDFESGAESFRVQANGKLVSWTAAGLPRVRLRHLALEPAPGAPPQDGTSKLTLQEFAVARRLSYLPRPPSHPELDEVWLEAGDQVFGWFQSLNARELALAMRNVSRRLPTRQIRGLFPKVPSVHYPRAATLWQITLVDPGGAEPARFTGTIRSWDNTSVVLVHSLLGELKLPSAHVRSVSRVHASPIELLPGPTEDPKP
jgi:hypothetical protein